jgi:hypothetical protein
VFTGLSEGTAATVRNAKQCVETFTITITEPDPLTARQFYSHTSCRRTIITVTPAGGNGGYLYNFNGLGYTTDNVYR